MKFTPLLLTLCCLLAFSGCSLFKPVNIGGSRPSGTRPAPTSELRTGLTSQAQDLLGVKYKYGGNTPREGFDCSGFVRYIYQDAGLDLPRISRDQAKQGQQIRQEEARPGDLVFFRRSSGQPVFHVSLVVMATKDEIWVIHSTTSNGVIRENILASSYWRPKIYQIRSVIR